MRRTIVRTGHLPEDDRRAAQSHNYDEVVLVVSACGTEVTDGSGGGGGGGTVTTVGLSLPVEFTVTGSPVTTVGTLTGAWASEAQNLVLASPNGSSGTPTFRALVGADLPTIGALGPIGDATHVARVTTDAQGRVIALTSVPITGGGGGGAGGIFQGNVVPGGVPGTVFSIPQLLGINPSAIELVLNGLVMDQVVTPSAVDEFSVNFSTLTVTTFRTINVGDKFKAFLWANTTGVLANVVPTGVPGTSFTVPTLGGNDPTGIELVLNGLMMDQVVTPSAVDEFSLVGHVVTTFRTINVGDKFKSFLFYS